MSGGIWHGSTFAIIWHALTYVAQSVVCCRSRLILPAAREVLGQSFWSWKACGLAAAEAAERDHLAHRVAWNPDGLGFPGAGLEDDRAAAASLLRFSPCFGGGPVLGAPVATVSSSYGWLELLGVQGGPVRLDVLLPLLCGEPTVVTAPLERDPLTGRRFHDETSEGQATFAGEGARLMGGHEDAVPAPAVPGIGGVLRVVGFLRTPGERAVLAALAFLQDEVAVLDRDGVLLYTDDGGRQIGCADVRDGADACVVRVGEVPDRLNTAAAPEPLPCTHSAGCLGAQLRLVAQDDAVGAIDAYVEAGVSVGGLRLDIGVEAVIFGILRNAFLAREVLVGLVADGLVSGFAVVGGEPYAVTLDEVHGDTSAANVPAVGADQSALFDGDASSHAQEHLQEVFALRDTEVGAVQVEVAGLPVRSRRGYGRALRRCRSGGRRPWVLPTAATSRTHNATGRF